MPLNHCESSFCKHTCHLLTRANITNRNSGVPRESFEKPPRKVDAMRSGDMCQIGTASFLRSSWSLLRCFQRETGDWLDYGEILVGTSSTFLTNEPEWEVARDWLSVVWSDRVVFERFSVARVKWMECGAKKHHHTIPHNEGLSFFHCYLASKFLTLLLHCCERRRFASYTSKKLEHMSPKM